MADLMIALRNAHNAGDTSAAKRIAAMIKSQQQPAKETTIGEDIVGGIETIASIGSGIVADPLAGLAGIAQSLNPFSEEGAGAEAVADVKEALTYKPRGDAAKGQLKAIGDTLAPVGKAIQSVESGIGESVLDMTNSPFLATIAHTLPTAALELLGFKGAKSFRKRAAPPKSNQIQKAIVESAPEIKQLKKASKAIYDEIDNSGVTIKPNSIDVLVNRVTSKTKKEGLDPRVTKQAAGALEALQEIKGTQQPITELMIQKKIAQNVASSLDPTEKRLGVIMVDEIDSFIDSLSSEQLLKGDVSTSKKLKVAGKLWGRARRSELIQEAMEKGANRASGADLGIRNEFTNLANNKRKSRFFSKVEIKALRDVGAGDFKRNLTTAIGKLGVSVDRSPNVFQSIIGGGAAGLATSGSPVALLVPAVGTVSRSIGKKLTKNKAKFADAITRAGNNANEITKAYLTSVPKAKRSVQDLADLLSDPNINLDDLKMIANETLRDASDLAKGQRAINAAAGVFAALSAQRVSENKSNNKPN
jgi:hypothetical protein